MEEWATQVFIVAIALISALFLSVLLQVVLGVDPAQVRLKALALASVTAGLLFGEMVLTKFGKDHRRR